MNSKEIFQFHYIIILWTLFAVSVIYWHTSTFENKQALSKCHNAPVKIYYDRPMCTQCKLFVEEDE